MHNQAKDPQNPYGPIQTKNWTMHVDKDLCIGAATCVAIAPQAFLLDSDAKAFILNTVDQEDQSMILDAARGCPVAAIIIKDEKGETIFPK